MPSWLFQLMQVAGRLWVTVALYSALGLLAALAAALFGHWVPSDFPLKLGSDSVDEILSILASSMLAVATFSLTTLVTAYTSVVSNAAPRAAHLLVSDRGLRNALSTFVGAFIYSIVGIIALHTGYYGAQGRVILFFVTLVVLALVVLAMVRWIGLISRLAQVSDAVDRVADAAGGALRSTPITLARRHGHSPPREGRIAINAESVGFVRNVDIEGLEAIAAELGLQVHVAQLPGAFVHGGVALLHVDGSPSTAEQSRLRGKVSVRERRTFDQDPGYGFTVLGEIASRALSPGVNDPGTAREVMAATVGLLSAFAREDPAAGDRWPHVTVAAFPICDLVIGALEPVARNGADQPLLQAELQAALLALTLVGDEEIAESARELSRLALTYARQNLARREDVRRVTRAAGKVLAR
ncbi:MAG TPA: DUF2254 family protein [Caulobacteraceae bacterium]